jgi:RNA polymerase-interacting CarD/CdnL/TRCF family regulator
MKRTKPTDEFELISINKIADFLADLEKAKKSLNRSRSHVKRLKQEIEILKAELVLWMSDRMSRKELKKEIRKRNWDESLID